MMAGRGRVWMEGNLCRWLTAAGFEREYRMLLGALEEGEVYKKGAVSTRERK
jgi:hypothetical protein